MYRIRKSIDIDFSHHVRGHQGACINVHGHTWRFEVMLGSETLDSRGFVVDFKELKREVLAPCHSLLDHALALGRETFAETESALEVLGKQLLSSRDTKDESQDMGQAARGVELAGAMNVYPGGMKVAVFPFNPTSERLAKWLYDLSHSRLEDERVRVLMTRIYETQRPVPSVGEYVPS